MESFIKIDEILDLYEKQFGDDVKIIARINPETISKYERLISFIGFMPEFEIIIDKTIPFGKIDLKKNESIDKFSKSNKSEKELAEWVLKNENNAIYKMKIWHNFAETSRSINNIYMMEEKYFNTRDSAVEFLRKYIKENFINTGCFRINGVKLICIDVCSFGQNIELQKIFEFIN